MKFLTAYGLQKYDPLFSQAILSEDFSRVTHTILSETGLMLIHFTSMPDIAKNRYNILETVILSPVQKHFFLFWKPSPVISTYENGVKGAPIRQLQTLLKKMDLYHNEINGVVSTELTRALIRFQRQHLLDPTGFPDPPTLFLLTHLST